MQVLESYIAGRWVKGAGAAQTLTEEDALAIAVDQHACIPVAWLYDDAYAELICERSHAVRCLLDDPLKTLHFQVECKAAGLGLFKIEDVVDQPHETHAVGLCNVDQALRFGAQFTGCAAGEQAKRA